MVGVDHPAHKRVLKQKINLYKRMTKKFLQRISLMSVFLPTSDKNGLSRPPEDSLILFERRSHAEDESEK